MTTIADVLERLEHWYPPHTAAEWDRVGLAVGDPAHECRRVLLAVDATPATVAEAVGGMPAGGGADLLVTHHPLLLRGVSSVAATTPKGRMVHDLVRGGCALYTAHTNADIPADGVSEALALALGLVDLVPLDANPQPALDKVVVFVPTAAAAAVREAMSGAGAGAIGEYAECSWTSTGQGRFRPGDGARPSIGRVGELEVVEEARVEMVMPRSLREAVVAAMRAAHPYEEPAYDVLALAALAAPDCGLGRVGTLASPGTLADFAARVREALPATAHGVRVAGDPDREVRRVAVLGGAGDSHLDHARHAGVDAFVTSDLRHHPAAEFLEHDGPALVDVSHWAAEWTWLPVVRRKLVDALGDTVEVAVSTTCTDPWDFRP